MERSNKTMQRVARQSYQLPPAAFDSAGVAITSFRDFL
jgi:hypothetical protein